MFGGLIAHLGFLKWLTQNQIEVTVVNGYSIEMSLGDSVAINGICLTIVNLYRNLTDNTAVLTFEVCQETLDKTTLIFDPDVKQLVNVEFSLRLGQSLGGHILTGHIFTKGKIVSYTKTDTGYDIWIHPLDYWSNASIIYKNSVAVDGVSLTIAQVDPVNKFFRVSLLSYTVENTSLQNIILTNDAEKTKWVNLEFNIVMNEESQQKEQQVSDSYFMHYAWNLSEKGRFSAPPNPWVGCVLVNQTDNEIIGEGYHVAPGMDHAEVVAIKDAHSRGKIKANNAYTLYVTLEPCHHQGRTPPCDVAIVNERVIHRVVIGVLDPDRRVSGQGKAFLEKSGIQVDLIHPNDDSFHALEKISQSLQPYCYSRIHNLPFCVAKIATSLDGHICDAFGNSKWITSEEARADGHRIRACSQAIIVGSKTAILDMPRLNVRSIQSHSPPATQPLRVILDTHGKVSPTGPLFDAAIGGETLIFTIHNLSHRDQENAKWIQVPQNIESDGNVVVSIKDVLSYLYAKRGVLQCLIEGGPTIQTSFLQCNLLQQIIIYESCKVLGMNGKSWTKNLQSNTVESEPFLFLQEVSTVGQDLKKVYLIK